MPFCDITIMPVRTKKKPDLRFPERMAIIYREHGALRVRDFWQEDAASDDASFYAKNAMATNSTVSLPNSRMLAGATKGQTVAVSMTEWPNRQARVIGVKAAISDTRILATMDKEPIFKGSKLIAGGFNVELDVD